MFVDILQEGELKQRRIFLQHKAGPCPIIAIANCLSLVGTEFLLPGDIHPSTNVIDIAVLVERLTEYVIQMNQVNIAVLMGISLYFPY